MLKSRFFLALLCLILINLLTYSWSAGNLHVTCKALDLDAIKAQDRKSRQTGTWTWWVTRQFLSERKPPDVVLLGSSQMASALFSADANLLGRNLDCVKYRGAATLEEELHEHLKHRPKVFDYAMGGAMISDQFMISSAVFQNKNKPRLIILGISPRDFMDNCLPSASATEQFRFFLPYVELDSLASLAFVDVFDHFAWLAEKYMPLKSVHVNADKQIGWLLQNECGAGAAPDTKHGFPLTQQLLNAISGGSGEVRPGEWIIPHSVSFGFVDNTAEYQKRYKDPSPPIYKAEREFFKQLLTVLNTRDIKVLVVVMPTLPPNRSLLSHEFWSDFKKSVARVCAQHDVPWLDLSDNSQFTIDDYIDTVHLNASGGRKLFREMAMAVSNNAKLALSLRQSQTENSLLEANVHKVPNREL